MLMVVNPTPTKTPRMDAAKKLAKEVLSSARGVSGKALKLAGELVDNKVKNPRAKSHARKPRPKKAASKGASSMAKKRRSAAQKAATKKMLAANRSKRHRNPSPKRRKSSHRSASSVRHYKRKRNPSTSVGSGSIFKELLSKEGLMMVAAVVVTPTITELLVNQVAPTSTGYTRSGIKAGLGLAAAWAVHRFASKKAGMVVGLVSIGTAVAESIRTYQASSLSGSSTAALAGYLGSYDGQSQPGQLRGYLGDSLYQNDGNLGAYSEPGTVNA